ncbi:MAG: hypothetical protein MSC31_17000 [Solirubrobacteraceae bacterium MAG38_C4-C5]|nr:hypothetical protein [Candidatus Siliceabacter maunaloa]
MSVQISVALDERGPTTVRVTERDRHGAEQALERRDPYLEACEQAAYELLLAQGRRLPAGTIDVVVREDERRHYPPSRAVGGAIARAA